jgi:hypothetical protein
MVPYLEEFVRPFSLSNLFILSAVKLTAFSSLKKDSFPIKCLVDKKTSKRVSMIRPTFTEEEKVKIEHLSFPDNNPR